jgi:carboxymethylenebutenolidase
VQIIRRNVGLTVGDSLMRVYVSSPKPVGQYPGILFYSDIYQLGSPITRLADRLAGYGYVVAAPEIFHRLEPIGSAIAPDDLGRLRGNDNASRTAIAEYDADAEAVLDFLKKEEMVMPDNIGTLGFCIGGHLAFRAAFNDAVKASVCCYPTGIHNGKLGKDPADTLERLAEFKGELFMLFGTLDPHIPEAGRTRIMQELVRTGVSHTTSLYEANHTFMRDDGDRFDPAATDAAWAEITRFLHQVFA